MRLQDDIDFTTLNWVKQELDETLKQARQALEAYVDEPADSSLMRFCATYLHQVQGTLRMVELYGAAMIVEEMERLAQALLDGEIRQKDDAYSVLMRGIVQLPDYLERLQSGHKDIPIVLLPLLNDLRACRGEELFSESVLFSPDLSLPLPPNADGAAQALTPADLTSQLGKLRTIYQVCLLKWLRATDPKVEAEKLSDALRRVLALSHADNARRVWWIGGAVLEGVQMGGLDPSPAVRLLFGKVDREIKRLVDSGESAFQAAPPRELLKNLLYYVAHAQSGGPQIDEVRRTFKLASLLPTDKELEHAKGSISGHNRALLDTVSLAIKDDLVRVKEALDIFLRAQNSDPAELMAQVDVLDRVGDTLGMLGLGVPRRVVIEQRQIVEEIANKTRPTDESTLLDVAGALLYIEASLDDHIERLGADTPEDTGKTGMELPKAEVRKILDALMKEATVNLAQAKNDIVAFIESPWDHVKVEQIPRLLEEVSGALRMLDLNQPSDLMHGLVRFIEVELLRWRRVPTAEQMDKLADTIASLEYYLEATRDQRAGREKILDVTRLSLESLGYWPVPEDDGSMPEPPPDGGAFPSAKEPAPAAQGPAIPASAPSGTPAGAGATSNVFDARNLAPTHDERAVSAEPARLDASEFGEFLSFGETITETRSEALRMDTGEVGSDSQLPTIEMMPDGELDEYLARVGATLPDVAPLALAEPERIDTDDTHELHVAVEIAPGADLDALLIGENPPTPERMHDLTGLRLTETEPTSPPDVAAPQFRYIEVEEEVEEEVTDDAPSHGMGDASFQAVASDDIDEEIREVFVEEVQEEIDNLNRHLPLWKSDVHDFERLKPVRRSFHTLKGSGRLVGAMALGEFSWKVENMLNRVLDKTVHAGPAAVSLVDQAIGALPELLAALRGEGAPTTDIAGIMAVADRLAAGEEAWLTPARPRTRTVKRIVKRTIAVPVEVPVVATNVEMSTRIEPAVELSETVNLSHDFQIPEREIAAVLGESAELPGSGLLPNIDPVLFDILRSEVAQHLAVVDGFVDASAHASPVATDTLLRAVHTLHGAIAMVDIPVIGHVLAPLEGYVKRLRAREAAPGPIGLAVLRDASSLVREVMLELEKPQPQFPNEENLAERIVALSSDLPEPDLAHIFYDEATDDSANGVSPDEFSAPANEEFPLPETALLDLDSSAMFSDLDGAAHEETAIRSSGVSDDAADEELGLSLLDEFEDDAARHPDREPVSESLSMETEHLAFEDLPEPQPLEASTNTAIPSVDAIAETTSWDGLEVIESLELVADGPTVLSGDEHAAFDALLADSLDQNLPATGSQEHEVGFSTSPSAAEATQPADFDSILLSADEQAEFDALLSAEMDVDAESAPRFDELPAIEVRNLDDAATNTSPFIDNSAESKLEIPRLGIETMSEHIATVTSETIHTDLAEEPAPGVSAAMLDSQTATPEADGGRGTIQAIEETSLPPIADDLQPDGKLDLPDMDEDLLEIFVQEGADILDHSDALIARLRDSRHDREIVTGMQRDLHTLKGGARMAGLAPIGDLSHAMESLLEAISEGRRGMDRATVESFERGYDRLHSLVQRVAHRQAIAMPEHAIARFEALVDGSLSAQLHAAALAAQATQPVVVQQSATDRGDEESGPTAPAPAPAAAVVVPIAPEKLAKRPTARDRIPTLDEEEPRAPQEMIRVRSDLLDSLVNYAGEVSIYRSRLEQQVTNFRFNLVEFEQTVSRLREQLRKLEIETEAQIIARYQREHQETGETTFDPLELDRFSQLQQLSRALGESVSDLVSIQNLLDDLTRQSETLLLQQSRVSSDLQEGLMRTRMVPFDSLVPSLRRTVRQAAQEVGKRAQIKVEGAQGEMDRNLLERMKAPFEHMLRNALAHGIETPDDRQKVGKNSEGTVTIQVSREATEVVLRVSDDGRGMDRDAIRRRAIERGLLNADVQLSDRDLYAFILETGFSTAEQVTQLAGRGVGMDVVHNEIKQLGGSLMIDSERGKGSVFTIRLPFTLAVTQAILVRLGESIYAIPMSSVLGVVRIGRDDLERRLLNVDPIYTYSGDEFHIYELPQLLNVPAIRQVDETQVPLLMTRTGDQRAAVRIDGVVGSREVVVKSVGPQISSVPGIFGATIMGDGSVVMILDLAPLVRRFVALRAAHVESGTETRFIAPVVQAPVVEERRNPLVMVVDDSITMRKVTTRVLERNDMDVITAKDGLDAVEKLQDKVPDLMLLDIEMPRMDGYELATYMKNDPRLKLVPIIMITSRTGEKHRQRALEIGVERYLGKPYQEVDLLRNVQETLRLSRA
ncbi:MAG: Hpt domain-containing protein [Tahibacter sp.]